VSQILGTTVALVELSPLAARLRRRVNIAA
jgi:hypothetical protein